MTPEKAQSQTQPYDAFRALPGPLAVRDVRDLMTYPFFSLAKSPRTAPIHFRTANVSVRVEGAAEQGLATIWDCDVMIWAASQLMQARDSGLSPARRIVAAPREILRFIGRGTSARDYFRLRAALDRLKATRVAACLRNASSQDPQCFSWISDWKEGLEIVVSDWFYDCVVRQRAVLTIDRAYFNLTGGVARWLSAEQIVLRSELVERIKTLQVDQQLSSSGRLFCLHKIIDAPAPRRSRRCAGESHVIDRVFISVLAIVDEIHARVSFP